MNNVAVVSYEAPNVIDSLPKDKKEKALREIIKIKLQLSETPMILYLLVLEEMIIKIEVV